MRALWHSKKSTTISFLPGLPSCLTDTHGAICGAQQYRQYHKTLSMIPMMLSQHLPNTTQLNSTQLNSTQHNSTQHNSPTQHNTTQLNTTQHNSTQHNSTQHNTTQLNTTQHNSTQLNTTQHNTTQLNTTQQSRKSFSKLPRVRYEPTALCPRQVYSNYSQLR